MNTIGLLEGLWFALAGVALHRRPTLAIPVVLATTALLSIPWAVYDVTMLAAGGGAARAGAHAWTRHASTARRPALAVAA